MIKIEYTSNFLGINIYGDYNDLELLYKSINNIIDSNNIICEHTNNLLDEIRSSYSGNRDYLLNTNNIDLSKLKNHNINKKDISLNNLYYGFKYSFPDIMIDYIIINHFDKKNIFNIYSNYINYFYGLIFDKLRDTIGDIKINKIKNGLIDCNINERTFYLQWFEFITCNYIKMNKDKRIKNFSKIMNYIYNYQSYKDYLKMRREILNICKEKNISINDYIYEDYPNNIEW